MLLGQFTLFYIAKFWANILATMITLVANHTRTRTQKKLFNIFYVTHYCTYVLLFLASMKLVTCLLHRTYWYGRSLPFRLKGFRFGNKRLSDRERVRDWERGLENREKNFYFFKYFIPGRLSRNFLTRIMTVMMVCRWCSGDVGCGCTLWLDFLMPIVNTLCSDHLAS